MKKLKKFMALGLAATMLMSNATSVFATEVIPTVQNVAGWKSTLSGEQDTLFKDQDMELGANNETDMWKKQSEKDNIIKFVNTSNPTKLTVSLQKNATLNGVKINVYQIMGIIDTADGEDAGASVGTTDEYSYTLMNQQLKKFFEDYFSLDTADEASILRGLESLETSEARKEFSIALEQYIQTVNKDDDDENDIVPDETYNGENKNAKSCTIDISRQYTYDKGTKEGKYTLGKGYYFITRTDAIDDTYTLRVIDKDQTSIELKGTVPTLEKSADDVVMAVGDTVNYTLQSKLTYSKGNTDYVYTIYDHLEDSMTTDINELLVTISSGDDKIVLMRGEDYTVEKTTYDESESKNDVDGDGESNSNIPVIAINLKFDANSRLFNDAYVGYNVIVTYPATMTNTATTGNATGNENYNKAWLSYGAGESITETLIAEWNVYTIALEITKEDHNGSELEGAKFALYDLTKQNTYKFSKVTKGDGASYYYLDNARGNSELISDKNGKIEIRGLDEGSYILSETKAPAGYLAIPDQVLTIETGNTFTFLNAGTTDQTSTTIDETDIAEGYIRMTIKDPAQGSDDLPATGGTGRVIIYVIGSLLLIGGATGYVVSRKKHMV